MKWAGRCIPPCRSLTEIRDLTETVISRAQTSCYGAHIYGTLILSVMGRQLSQGSCVARVSREWRAVELALTRMDPLWAG